MKEPIEKFSISRESEDGMVVELVGNQNTIANMLRSALMSHAQLRRLIIPIVTDLISDKEFLSLMMDDILTQIKKKDDEDDIIDLD